MLGTRVISNYLPVISSSSSSCLTFNSLTYNLEGIREPTTNSSAGNKNNITINTNRNIQTAPLDEVCRQSVNRILETANRFQLLPVSVSGGVLETVTKTILESFAVANKKFGVDCANEWANGFTFPPGVGDQNVEDLRRLN